MKKILLTVTFVLLISMVIFMPRMANSQSIPEDKGLLTVEKFVINKNGGTAEPQDFSFDVIQDAGAYDYHELHKFNSNGINEFNFPNGWEYEIKETQSADYDVEYVGDCKGTIQGGHHIFCFVVNHDKLRSKTIPSSNLIVEKRVVNENGGTKEPSDFRFILDVIGPNDYHVSKEYDFNSDGKNEFNFTQGTYYTITEIPSPGYATHSVGCSGIINGTIDEPFSLCLISNYDQPQDQLQTIPSFHLLVEKKVNNENGGTKNPSDFKFDLQITNSNGSKTFTAYQFNSVGESDLLLYPGEQYSIIEAPSGNYALESYDGACSGTAEPGGYNICTITNVYNPQSNTSNESQSSATPIQENDSTKTHTGWFDAIILWFQSIFAPKNAETHNSPNVESVGNQQTATNSSQSSANSTITCPYGEIIDPSTNQCISEQIKPESVVNDSSTTKPESVINDLCPPGFHTESGSNHCFPDIVTTSTHHFYVGGVSGDISPYEGPPGSMTLVSGDGYKPGSTVVITIDPGIDSIVKSVVTDNVGSYKLQIQIPLTAASGFLPISIDGISSYAYNHGLTQPPTTYLKFDVIEQIFPLPVTIQVLDADSGLPINGALVHISGGSTYLEKDTNQDGILKLSLNPYRYNISAESNEYERNITYCEVKKTSDNSVTVCKIYLHKIASESSKITEQNQPSTTSTPQVTPTTPNDNQPQEIIQLIIPQSIVAEATSSSGATVNYDASESSGGIPVCNPSSGSIFPIGNTNVMCIATDSSGKNSIHKSFTVTVQDTTPPVISPFEPHNDTPDDTGAIVYFTISSVDLVDGPVTPSCDHTSGEKFPLGVTTITCTATDSHGNTSKRSLQISITKS